MRLAQNVKKLVDRLMFRAYKESILECAHCYGEGRRNIYGHDDYGTLQTDYNQICPNCEGKGRVLFIKCYDEDVKELETFLSEIYKRGNELKKKAEEKHKLKYIWWSDNPTKEKK